MSSISSEWLALRDWGSRGQESAFEELCCQLAFHEHEALQIGVVSPIRLATPDGGVECYWNLNDGTIWAWQAKYFLQKPNAQQWSQVTHSIETALKGHHGKISRYTICMPLNRPKSSDTSKNWFLDEWNRQVEKWEALAKKNGLIVQFEFWGDSEIFDRLALEEHRGRKYFWFHKESFSQAWFEDHMRQVVKNAGPRYTPEIHVETELVNYFDAICVRDTLYKEVLENLLELKRYIGYYERRLDVNEQDTLHSWYYKIEHFFVQGFASQELLHVKIENIFECFHEWLNNAIKAYEEKVQDRNSYSRDEGHSKLQDIESALYKLERFLKSDETKLQNQRLGILVGEAGSGKTHLLCDVLETRVKSRYPAVLLLGQHFKNVEPWRQIMELLHLSSTMTPDEFLGILDVAGAACGSRALIMIDALNESSERWFWQEYLAGMAEKISRYKHVALVVSIRSTYIENVLGDYDYDHWVRFDHHGFEEVYLQAIERFFDHYGLEYPNAPLLDPEFFNPLFLKTFCETFQGQNKIPNGVHSISDVFNRRMEMLNQKLAKPQYLDYRESKRLVQKALEKLAEAMVAKEHMWLAIDEADAIVETIFPSTGASKSLLIYLIDEGFVTEDFSYSETYEELEGIRFGYERFFDYIHALHVIDQLKALPENQQMVWFESLLPEKRYWSFKSGLIEMLSILIPEHFGKELYRFIPKHKTKRVVMESFLKSFLWRRNDSFTNTTRSYLNKVVLEYLSDEKVLDMMLSVCAEVDHPYNAKRLHKILSRYSMPEHDRWWSVYVYNAYQSNRPVSRLIEWVWHSNTQKHINDEAALLLAITLSWFLTTSHRFARDRATKALVALLENRLHLFSKLFFYFKEVDDLYIHERLYGAAYGAALRSSDKKAVVILAKQVYRRVFKDEKPPVHVMLRDYARGICELALRYENGIGIDVKKIRPPYVSEWNDAYIDDALFENEDSYRDNVYHSIFYDDFGDYIIGRGPSHWLNRRITDGLHVKQKLDHFQKTLSKKAHEYFDQYRESKEYFLTSKDTKNKELLGMVMSFFQKLLITTLNDRQKEVFESVEWYLDHSKSRHRSDEGHIDINELKKRVYQRVLELGWSKEIFQKAEDALRFYTRNGRTARKAERLGKKYQWLAWHELLAQLYDNFEYDGRPYDDVMEGYEGTWQEFLRDIDPSCLIQTPQKEMWWYAHSPCWWVNTDYKNWQVNESNASWVAVRDDLPKCSDFFNIAYENGTIWMPLDGTYRWKQKRTYEEKLDDARYRDLYCGLSSYIVKDNSIETMRKLVEFYKDLVGNRRDFPSCRETTRVFLGEFHRSFAHEYEVYDWYKSDLALGEIKCAYEVYMQEDANFDCSIDETIHIALPCREIVEALQLESDGKEGKYFNQKANLICQDPSVDEKGPLSLLMEKHALSDFLNQSGYGMFWVLFCEKNILGNSFNHKQFDGQLQHWEFCWFEKGEIKRETWFKYYEPRMDQRSVIEGK